MRIGAVSILLLLGCSGVEDRAALKEEIKKELLAELKTVPAEEVADVEVPPGTVEGRMTFRDRGVEGCRVKLVRILESSSFLGLLREAKRGAEFEARTDGEGRYRLEKIPPGSYRLVWQVPGDRGWIRRLRDRPDVVLKSGESVSVPEVKLGRRPLGNVRQ